MAKHIGFVVVLTFLLFCCTAAFGTNWFVATNGSDANAGDINNPFATFNAAVQFHAQPGDTIYVRAGTYTSLMNIGGDGYCAGQQPNHALIGGAPGRADYHRSL